MHAPARAHGSMLSAAFTQCSGATSVRRPERVEPGRWPAAMPWWYAGGVDGRFAPEMPVIWMPGQWVTAALRTGDRPAALSCGRSYWAHRCFGSEIENKTHWAGQVQVVPPFWSL